MNIQSVLATKGTAVLTVPSSSSVGDAVALLTANNIGALVVVDAGGQVCGILSERDIARSVGRHHAVHDLRVVDLMTVGVTCAALSDEVVTVLRLMTQARLRHIPVMAGGELAGLVSIGDLVKAQLSEDQGVILNLETMLMEFSR